jgi:RNA polymerase sigma factor (sigma-70 family)
VPIDSKAGSDYGKVSLRRISGIMSPGRRPFGLRNVVNADPLDDLLDKLCRGDASAAEQVFVAYEPYLRLVVRRMLPAQLRSKFDSVDVVHSIWADLLGGFRDAGWQFKDANHLRAFLVKATRNRFLDRVRKHKSATAHEQPLDAGHLEDNVPASDPRPSEIAQANDLWDQMLNLCSKDHRRLLELKRQGCSLEEISRQTGYHPSSVRRIFYDVAHRLAFKKNLEKQDGEV